MKKAINKELKTTKCMNDDCNEQSELLSENYEKFYCVRCMLDRKHTDWKISIENLDGQLLDLGLEILKEHITSFYVSLSSVTDQSNQDKLGGVNAQNVQDPEVNANTLVSGLDI